MGFFKKLGKGLTKVASFTPGIGGIVASGANAALEGRPIGKSIIGNMGRNSNIAAQLLPLAMSGGAAGAGGGGFLSSLSGGGALGGLKKLGGFALDNQDLLLGGLSAYQAHKAGNKADKAAQRALDFAERDYEARAPLREQGMRRLLAAPPASRGPIDPNRRVTFDAGPSSNPFLR